MNKYPEPPREAAHSERTVRAASQFWGDNNLFSVFTLHPPPFNVRSPFRGPKDQRLVTIPPPFRLRPRSD